MIEIKSVSKAYGEKRVLSDVAFTARDGEITGFVGPNGAGKSTLLNIVAGTIRPDSGTVLIDGTDFASAARPGATLGSFLSAEWIPSHLTATSYLRYLCDLQGIGIDGVPRLLQLVGLTNAAKQKVSTFSLGMRQRLGIAAVVAGDPQNLILDEPINGLDPDAIAWLREFLIATARRGRTVVLSSHHMAELSLVADHVVLLDSGRVTRQGPLADFVATNDRQVYIESDDLDAASDPLRQAGFEMSSFRRGLLIHNAEPADVGRIVFGVGASLSHLTAKTRTLEETYFEVLETAGSSALTGSDIAQ